MDKTYIVLMKFSGDADFFAMDDDRKGKDGVRYFASRSSAEAAAIRELKRLSGGEYKLVPVPDETTTA